MKSLASDGAANSRQLRLVELAHQLADELRLPPLRAEARQPARLGDGVFEPLGQGQRCDLLRAQRDQLLAQLRELVARALASAAAAALLHLELVGTFRLSRFLVTGF